MAEMFTQIYALFFYQMFRFIVSWRYDYKEKIKEIATYTYKKSNIISSNKNMTPGKHRAVWEDGGGISNIEGKLRTSWILSANQVVVEPK